MRSPNQNQRDMTMSLPGVFKGVFKFILGFALAIALLFLAGAGMTRYMLARLATPPPRPTFPNDPSPTAANSPAATAPVAEPAASPSAVVSPSPSPSPASTEYRAKVNQPIGLIVRAEPDANAAQIAGVEFNRELTVLEDSSDGAWQKVRLADGTEGWVKGGNTERIN